MNVDEPTIDRLAEADVRNDEERDSSACSVCGSRTPARLSADGCSDCRDFPRCGLCRRWVSDGAGWLPGYRMVQVIENDQKRDMRICDVCWGQTA